MRPLADRVREARAKIAASEPGSVIDLDYDVMCVILREMPPPPQVIPAYFWLGAEG